MNIGKRISTLRQMKNFSQDDLSVKLHVSRQTISNWENDRTYPDINSLVMLSDIFAVSLDNLVKEDLPLIKNKIKQTQIRLLAIGSISVIILTYLCLLVLKWSVSLGSLLVGATTVLGLVMIYYFSKVINSANLKTFRQVVDYVNGKPSQPITRSKKQTIVQTLIGLVIGLALGLLIIWLIFHFVLHVL
ncbi:helix-turn-helix transcriptional regulator [Companilactobacillus sp.]|uniref:helix-turn-helix domain-containing protein n=1 Tax=Companilactobacillus sp. TaxID=2767905 RepID=UPI00262524E3|nr:helix-turn-helix transcriptional regulator [Companilactobacillus sp.]